MLNQGELLRMQSEAARALPGTAVLKHGTLVHDGGGGYSHGYSVAGTVACRIGPISSAEHGEIGDRINAEAELILTLPAGTQIETDDLVEVGTATYNVVGVRERSWEVTCRVEVKEVE